MGYELTTTDQSEPQLFWTDGEDEKGKRRRRQTTGRTDGKEKRYFSVFAVIFAVHSLSCRLSVLFEFAVVILTSPLVYFCYPITDLGLGRQHLRLFVLPYPLSLPFICLLHCFLRRFLCRYGPLCCVLVRLWPSMWSVCGPLWSVVVISHTRHHISGHQCIFHF